MPNPPETVSQRGIADVGQTDRMQVVAEVYQCDIGRIRVGQRAEASSRQPQGRLPHQPAGAGSDPTLISDTSK
jgi:hypothetical protein